MYRPPYSYWMTVTGTYANCRRFHELLEANILTPEVFYQDTDASVVNILDKQNPCKIQYAVNEEEGTVEEVSDIDTTIGNIVQTIGPDITVELECINEDDHSQQAHHVWHKGKHASAYAELVIKSTSDLIKDIEEGKSDE